MTQCTLFIQKVYYLFSIYHFLNIFLTSMLYKNDADENKLSSRLFILKYHIHAFCVFQNSVCSTPAHAGSIKLILSATLQVRSKQPT